MGFGGVLAVLFVCILFLYNNEVEASIAGENPDAHYAVVRTKKGQGKCIAAVGRLATFKPTVGRAQNTAARLILKNGLDSIEVGWRVDPLLNGDDKCRLYMRTTINNTSFFNTATPNFQPISDRLPLGYAFNTTERGKGDPFIVYFFIQKEDTGDWSLRAGSSSYPEMVGLWGRNTFTKGGLNEPASYVEWGGEVFTPRGTPSPPMGSGEFPVNNMSLDCFFENIRVKRENGLFADIDLESFADSPKYRVVDAGIQDQGRGHVVFFGGPGGK